METFISIVMVISLVINILLVFVIKHINYMISNLGLSLLKLAEDEIVLSAERKKVLMEKIKDSEEKIRINEEKICELLKQQNH